MSTNKMIFGGIAVAVLILGMLLLGNIVETLDGGEIHVKQAAVTGTMSVRFQEGVYPQMWGKITKYYRTSETYLSKDDIDGGSSIETDAITVQFGGGGTAEVSSVTQWRLPLSEPEMLKIHRNFRSFTGLASQVRQWVIEVEKQTASTFKADETYSTRRGEFAQLISDQIANGLYATDTIEIEVPTNEVDEQGNPIKAKSTKVVVKKDENGLPVIVKQGIFKEYGIELVNHTLKDMDYDETIDRLINQKKQAEQEKAVAITNAEKARQDAITAEEQGKAEVAKAKAREEVAKITAITQAEKEKAVAELKAEQDLAVARLDKQRTEEEAKARLIKEKAEADANALKVKAGLTPQERAEFDVRIADLVSKNLASVDLPDMMIFGGGEGSPMNPWDAVGLESFMKISKDIQGK